MNKVILVGNLTRDPELTTTTSGITMCRFSIAVNRTYKNASGEREVDFINIVVWRALAENCEKYLAKGRKVCVCGSLHTRNYEDKDGNKRTATEVTADDVEFLSAQNENAGEARSYNNSYSSAPTKQSISKLEPVEDDGLPF